MVGIIYALLSALSLAITNVSLKKSYEDFPPSVAFLFDVVFGLIIWIPFSLIVGVQFDKIPIVFGYAVLSAILSEAFYFYVLSKGEISITGTILASYPIYTILFSLFINNERLLPLHWFFVSLTILGTIITSLPEKIEGSEFKKKQFILWALAGATAIGLSDSLSKNIIDKTSAQTFLFALAFAQIPIGLIYLKAENQSIKQFLDVFQKFKKYQFAIYGSLFNIVGVLFLWLAFQATMASIASPLTATYPGLVIVLAYIFLKERISLKDLIGLVIIILGVVGISRFY